MMAPDGSTSSAAARAASGLVLLAGIWLLVGWLVLGYSEAQRAVPVDIGAGLALVALAGYQLLDRPSRRASSLVVWVGVLLVVAPFALQYGYLEPVVAAIVNQLVAGVVVIGAGIAAARATPRSRATSGT